MRISVIIPALNEEHQLPELLDRLRWMPVYEIIVVDGGSTDGTVRCARESGATVHSAPRGRAHQLNAGAAVATGDVLWFVHADTRPPSDAVAHIRRALQRGHIGGAFRIWTTVDRGTHPLHLLFHISDIRSRRTTLFYGDQGIFVRSEVFHEVGGYPDLPVLEDLEFSRALRRRGTCRTVPANMTVSARRWEAQPVRYAILATTIPLLWRIGVPAQTLAGLWPTVRRPRDP